jgi:hypothetical protein
MKGDNPSPEAWKEGTHHRCDENANMNWTTGSGTSVGRDGLAEGQKAKEMLPNNVNLGF